MTAGKIQAGREWMELDWNICNRADGIVGTGGQGALGWAGMLGTQGTLPGGWECKDTKGELENGRQSGRRGKYESSNWPTLRHWSPFEAYIIYSRACPHMPAYICNPCIYRIKCVGIFTSFSGWNNKRPERATLAKLYCSCAKQSHSSNSVIITFVGQVHSLSLI